MSSIIFINGRKRDSFPKSTAAKFPTTEKHYNLAFYNTPFNTQIQQTTPQYSQSGSMYCQAHSSWGTHS